MPPAASDQTELITYRAGFLRAAPVPAPPTSDSVLDEGPDEQRPGRVPRVVVPGAALVPLSVLPFAWGGSAFAVSRRGPMCRSVSPTVAISLTCCGPSAGARALGASGCTEGAADPPPVRGGGRRTSVARALSLLPAARTQSMGACIPPRT